MRLRLLLPLVAVLAGCPEERRPTTLTLAPESLALTPGMARTIEATVLDQDGQPLPSAEVEWTSSDPAVASVDDGRVTAVAIGEGQVTARAGEVSASIAVEVKRQLNDACQLPGAAPEPQAFGGVPSFEEDPGAFVGTQQPYGTTEVAPADFDDDGDRDLVVFNYNWINDPEYTGAVFVYRNDGTNTFSDDTAVALSGATLIADNATRPVVFDANADGREDVFIGQGGYDAEPFPGAHNLYLIADADGVLHESAATHLVPDLMEFTHASAEGDVDCDGDVDLFEANINDFKGDRARLRINDGQGVLTSEEDRLPNGIATARHTFAELCDVERDGDLDLVLGGWDAVGAVTELLLNDGFGHYSQRAESPFPASHFPGEQVTVELRCVDLDLDGWPDLVVDTTNEYQDAHLALWRNQGDGTFQDATPAGLESSWTGGWIKGVFVTDLNADGWPDLVASGTTSAARRVLLNLGDGGFQLLPALEGVSTPDMLVPIPGEAAGRADLVLVPWGMNNTLRLFRNGGS